MPAPVILFGAFDRHNLGDLLLARVCDALLPGRELHFAGLADRDLRHWGGYRVRPLAALLADCRDAAGPAGPAPALVHVGGEILGCDAWQAAVMLLAPDEATATIARLEADPVRRLAWAQRRLAAATGDRGGFAPTLAPYVADRRRLPATGRIVHAGIGGVGLAAAAPALRAELLTKLAQADAIAVRDPDTQAALAAAGIASRLMPDPAVRVAELFGERIRARAGALPEPAGSYLAVQFSADFGDDDTLGRIATQLDALATTHGLRTVLFRAGAAPWHDDDRVLRATAARMRSPARVFDSLDLWELCALLAHARAFCGSSLHGRIVATAFGRPRLSIAHPSDPSAAAKIRACLRAWELPGLPGVTGVDGLAAGLAQALEADPARLHAHARTLAEACREGFAALGAPFEQASAGR